MRGLQWCVYVSVWDDPCDRHVSRVMCHVTSRVPSEWEKGEMGWATTQTKLGPNFLHLVQIWLRFPTNCRHSDRKATFQKIYFIEDCQALWVWVYLYYWTHRSWQYNLMGYFLPTYLLWVWDRAWHCCTKGLVIILNEAAEILKICNLRFYCCPVSKLTITITFSSFQTLPCFEWIVYVNCQHLFLFNKIYHFSPSLCGLMTTETILFQDKMKWNSCS